ncbi:MAG: crotonobetainyl-CoA:carnitine CoA-transferase CaiB-like acyl-CoA transferase [Gammaproteobacteria bacterium]|jgi:crotonobetainyl-CoA:carnitine CoA-transferase CaiB-like acyl-CoA transferase
MPQAPNALRPLEGIRVIELGQLIAGPFTGSILGYFGAEVIKVEPPGKGDAIRGWRLLDDDGTSFWWRSVGRNKKSVTINMREDKGRALVRQLMTKADVVIENFRPGTMEKWGLGPEDIAKECPELIYARISGFGQTGPYSSRPGYASVCEGMGGFRYVNGFPGQAPVRPNLSMGDTLAGIHAALGVLLALVSRLQDQLAGRPPLGQVVDTSICEAVLNMLEAVIPEYDGAQTVREPSGTTLTGIVPTNTYPCADGKYVIIGGNGDSIYQRLMRAAGRPDLADDPQMADNAGRVVHERVIDEAIAQWTASLPANEVLQIMEEAAVPAGPIYDVRDIVNDPHFQARGVIENVTVGGKPLKIPSLAPLLSRTPGRTDWAGPEVGEHQDEILAGVLGLSSDEIAQLQADGVV